VVGFFLIVVDTLICGGKHALYRQSELRLFTVLSIGSNLLVISAMFLIALFFFHKPLLFYRNLSLVFVIFSGFFKVQIFMYKVIILEKRMLHVTGPSLQHFKVATHSNPFTMVLYFIHFWITMVGLMVTYALNLV